MLIIQFIRLQVYTIVYIMARQNMYLASLQNILLFTWPAIYSTGDFERVRKNAGREEKKRGKSLNAGESIKKAHLAS